MTELELMGEKALNAKRLTAKLGINAKNKALEKIAELIILKTDYIISENNKDMENGKAAGMNQGLLDRLLLTPERIKEWQKE